MGLVVVCHLALAVVQSITSREVCLFETIPAFFGSESRTSALPVCRFAGRVLKIQIIFATLLADGGLACSTSEIEPSPVVCS